MPISSPRDPNRIPALIGTLDTDGATVVAIKIDPLLHRLKVLNGTTGTNHAFTNAQKDADRVPTIWGVSSADGVTPIPIYTDSNGNLLTTTT